MSSDENNETDNSSQPSQSEGVVCSICMEKFSESGSHYISCLNCGHIFGYTCIVKWLKTRLVCPSCNQKAKKRDIRRIYLPHTLITMQDTGALEEMKQQWLHEVERKELLSNELFVTKNQLKRLEASFTYLTQRYYQLQQEYQILRQSVRSNNNVTTRESIEKFPLQLIRTLSVKNPRAFVFGKGTSLYSSYREDANHEYLQQISFWSDHKSISKQAIHESTIRDIRYLYPLNCPSQSCGLLLTCSTDKSLKVVCPQNMNVVLSYSLENVGWCCDWSIDGLYMACGMKNGSISIFDIRKTNNCLYSTNLSSCKGIHSIAWVTNTSLVAGGIDGVYYLDAFANRNDNICRDNPQLSENDKQENKTMFATCMEEMHGKVISPTKSLIVSYRSCWSPTNHIIYNWNILDAADPNCTFQYPESCAQLIGGKNHLLLSRTLAVCLENVHYFLTADESLQGSALLWEWKNKENTLRQIPETFPIRHSSCIYDIRWNSGLVDDIPGQALVGTLSREELHIYKC